MKSMTLSILSVVAACAAFAAADVNVFNVRDFGARGDGKTPDSAAVQRAIDAAGKVKGTVWFPAGEYPCHDLKVPPHVMLRGDPVWIFRTEKCGAVLQLDDPSAKCVLDITGAFGVHVYGLMLSGLKKTPQPVHGILLGNFEKFSPKEDSVFIDDCKVMNFSGHGAYLKRVWMFTIRHSQFMANAGCGVMIHGWDGFVTDNMFSANGSHGFGCEDCGATVMFTANRVEWNRGVGLLTISGDAWNITGNSFDRNYHAGLSMNGTSASAVTGNLFRRCGKDARMLKEGERSCQVRLSGCRGVSFVGNTCRAGRDDGGKGLFTPQTGIQIEKLACCVIKDNTLHQGYMDEMIVDYGGHGKDVIVKDNVGTRMGR
jgi:hypothetical protein